MSRAACDLLADQCGELELQVRVLRAGKHAVSVRGPGGELIHINPAHGQLTMLEQLMRGLKFDFAHLPVLCQGDSKDVRLLTPRVTVAKLLPTVYSFTHNRYGRVEGTEVLRSRFSARIFREMARRPAARHLSTAFLAAVESDGSDLLVERRVEPGNIEVRVKRYHIGSPIHRYRYTERHATSAGGPPLQRWSRFERPLVCFDWRHPLADEAGQRLADEPLSDDYAGVWLDDVGNAKRLALDTFEWIESRFRDRGLLLIDICFFIDRTGTVIFGEISPDCMRVRSSACDSSDALDKDEWRSGGAPEVVLSRYERLTQVLFGAHDPST